jgi:hypothetical protein
MPYKQFFRFLRALIRTLWLKRPFLFVEVYSNVRGEGIVFQKTNSWSHSGDLTFEEYKSAVDKALDSTREEMAKKQQP